MARQYRSTVEAKTLSSGINNSVTSMTLNSVSTLPSSYPYTLVIDPDIASEEIVTVTASGGGNVLTIVRGQDGTSAQSHNAAAVVKHMITARDLQEPHDHIDTTAAHGATGAVVGTTNTQTLTNKTLSSPTITGTAVLPSTTSIGSVSSTEIGYLDGVTSSIQTQFNALEAFPKGMISPFGGSSAPTGWLLCDGAAVSRTTYSGLFAVIGTTYGAGDTTSTFNVPDLLGRVPIGTGTGTGLTARTLGAKIGSESTTLTSSHIPQHNHTINHGHGHSIGVNTGGSHSHTLTMHFSGTASHDHAISGITNPLPSMQSDGTGGNITNSNGTSVSTVAAHDHGVTGAVTDHAGSSGDYGTASPTAVTAVQPSTVVNFIIKH